MAATNYTKIKHFIPLRTSVRVLAAIRLSYKSKPLILPLEFLHQPQSSTNKCALKETRLNTRLCLSVYCKIQIFPKHASLGFPATVLERWLSPVRTPLAALLPFSSPPSSFPPSRVWSCLVSKHATGHVSPRVASCVTGDPSPQVEVYYWPNPMGQTILTNQL